MSWTDIFPVLDDEMLDAYRAGVTDDEREEFEEWFGVKTRDCKTQDARQESFASDHGNDSHRPPLQALADGGASVEPAQLETEHFKLETQAATPPPHIVSATLFWKHVNKRDPELPRPTREMLVDARRMGLVKRFDPWGSYIEPLFTHRLKRWQSIRMWFSGFILRRIWNFWFRN